MPEANITFCKVGRSSRENGAGNACANLLRKAPERPATFAAPVTTTENLLHGNRENSKQTRAEADTKKSNNPPPRLPGWLCNRIRNGEKPQTLFSIASGDWLNRPTILRIVAEQKYFLRKLANLCLWCIILCTQTLRQDQVSLTGVGLTLRIKKNNGDNLVYRNFSRLSLRILRTMRWAWPPRIT